MRGRQITTHQWAPMVVLTLAFAIVGCYTILKHPITAEEGETAASEPHSQEYYRQNCVECHADYAEYPYGYFYGDYPDYYFEYPRWGYYYAYPWWWDRHWYDAPLAGDGTDGQIVGGEKARRRGDLIPPYVTGSPAVNLGGSSGGYVAPGTGLPGTKNPSGGATGAGGEQPEKQRVRMSGSDSTGSSDSSDAKSTKTQRRGGTRP